MKMKIFTLAIMLFAGSFLFPPATEATDFEFQPRLDAGWMFYSIEQAPMSKITPSQAGGSSGANLAQEKIGYSDTMAFVGGGGTFFFRRLFVDFSGQYAFNGNAQTHASGSVYDEAGNRFVSTDAEYHGQFDRTDVALSAGYAVSRRFSVYAGYKWAAIDLDITFEGPVSWLDINNWLASGRVKGEELDKFRYQGPFVGVTHGWEIDHPGWLKGLISAKVAVAFLNSRLSQDQTGAATYDTFNGLEIEPLVDPINEKKEIKGNTLGLAFGIDWRGMTAIQSLSYWFGLSGYRYTFDADDPDAGDVSETAVTFKTGLAYVF